MQTSSIYERPLRQLLSQLPREAKTFVKEEVDLVKKEVSEKLSESAHNAVLLIVGGVVAYAGLIAVFLGLGLLAGWGFQSLDWPPLAAAAAGVGFVGLAIVISGTVVLMKGLKSFKEGSLVPEKTLETLSPSATHAATDRHADKKEKAEDPRTTDELQAEALYTKSQMEETIEEIGMRLRPSHLKRQMERALMARPQRWAAVLAGSAMVGGFLLKRRLVRRGRA